MTRLLLAFLLLSIASPARAEFLDPDLSTLRIETVSEPYWVTWLRDGAYIGMCMNCDGMVLVQVQILEDDGTGARVHAGVTTPQTYTEIGRANAERLGGDADYIGTRAVARGGAKGFQTRARIATGEYSTTYQLWDDGMQLVVKVHGPDQTMVDELAEKAYRAAASISFR